MLDFRRHVSGDVRRNLEGGRNPIDDGGCLPFRAVSVCRQLEQVSSHVSQGLRQSSVCRNKQRRSLRPLREEVVELSDCESRLANQRHRSYEALSILRLMDIEGIDTGQIDGGQKVLDRQGKLARECGMAIERREIL